jgi:hypothetical protein
MNITQRLLAAALALAMPAALRAQQTPPDFMSENAYDVLGKALMPVADVFAVDDDGNVQPHGLLLDARLVMSGTQPQDLPVHIAVMTPDQVLIQAPFGGQTFTVCRDGDSLWAAPGSQVQALIGQATANLSNKKKKKREAEAEKVFEPLAAPVTRKELVFLPVLFQVQDDAGVGAQSGPLVRALDVQLMPQLEKALHSEGWTARVGVHPDYSIAWIDLTGPKWSGRVVIDKLDLPATLPEATFQPQGNDVLRLSGAQFLDMLGRVGSK